MISPFRRLHHVCIVVRDLDEAVAYYEKLGVGPWYDYPKGAPYAELEVPNPEGSASLRYKCADLENFQLQLCQPSNIDSPQKLFLDEHGEGVYHLGFESDLDEAQKFARSHGLHVIARGLRVDGSGFCYFDTRAGAGTVLSVRRTAPTEGSPRAR
jgi:catechol 2,3-dioxygenase-like lactoylglutathione lyase family enzyme